MKRPTTERLLELQELLLAFQSVKRVSRLPVGHQPENDVEHSYFLTMAVWYLSPHFPRLSADKMIRLALAHDLVEVHAGDTFVYGDQELIDNKPIRDRRALEQLEKTWPDFAAMTDSIHEYAERKSEEAKFVYVLDKLLPPMVNYLAGGEAWHANGVTIDDFRKEKEKKIPADSELYPYYQEILKILQQHPDLFARKR